MGAFPEKNLQASTLAKWQYGLTYLTQYVEETRESDPLSTGSAADLTVFWGKSYHRWLMKNGPMAAEAATRYVKRLVEAIDYQAEAGTIKQNPLATIKLSRAKTKDVYFLEPHHLERFWKLDLEERAGVACWWMGVIFLTGLDFPDAVEYVTNRHKYDQPTQWGNKIVIHRSKPPRAQCHIPILPELENLLRNQPAGPTPSDFEVNRVMYAVQVPAPADLQSGAQDCRGDLLRHIRRHWRGQSHDGPFQHRHNRTVLPENNRPYCQQDYAKAVCAESIHPRAAVPTRCLINPSL